MEIAKAPMDHPGFWAERYQRGQDGWTLGQPSPPLRRWLERQDTHTPKKVAVIGCGVGHDVVLFAQAGHRVTGFDFAEPALQRARANAEMAGIAAQFEQADIFALPPRFQGQFDLVVEHTLFCAINPARRAEYVRVVFDLLIANGTLVAVFWAHGQPGGPPFSTNEEDVRRLFAPYFDIQSLVPTPDSHPRRANEELLAVMHKRG